MSSKLSTFICQNCGTETSQYFGKCLNCNSWNSIVEEIKSKRSKYQDIKNNKKSIPFNEISSKKISRFTSGFREFDRVLGGGIVPGSVVLLGGEPGIGKSTIVLQSAGKISLNEKVLYITAEESLEQVKIRWERLNQSSINLKIFAETNLSLIIKEIKRLNPSFAIIDSIQAIHNHEMQSSPGSVSQVRACSSELQNLAKDNKKSIPFNEISSKKISRFTSGFREFDRVLGGGIVPGSVVLLGGEPGIGKSTIVLQSAGKISLNEKVLYITAEESLEQVKIRWERLNQNSIDLKIFAETNLSLIIEEIKRVNPSFAIIDSIQAIHNHEMESSPGSVSQVRACSSELQNLAKENNICLLYTSPSPRDSVVSRMPSSA